ncbi:serine/threonine-protein phosphatase 6 regulatory subunit 3-like isoform X2 [Hibiscus syriacus]|uniref:serine/threonine-protein phosphatase 6 regulatory subunit 3-like isoform X2 n=1 Tax=Hibiscus syriacus TaxID=106335 RepID=UPI0019204FAB|nr:serine/threonine-protein phosphatase 6 regulatory subunit 3-like isoform X2 [Hibiscus syriacus]
MFWRMTGLSTASPIDTILDKDNFTLEELLDEDEIIQECKSLNGRLINFLREKVQVEQLIQYIVVEPPENADKKQIFKFPSIACEIFTCEVDIVLKTLVEDEGLMNLLFSFLNKNHSHSTQLAGYFSRVVICLLLRKTSTFLQYIKGHQEIVEMLVDLIGITSIMEVLIRLIGADENMYTNYMESMQWVEDTNILEMIVDKFSSSDSAEVHANAAETLCAITRSAPPGLSAKITSPNFIGRLFNHVLEDLRPKSVVVNSLSVCVSLLDPKRLTLGVYHTYNRQVSQGSKISANPKTVEVMLENLGNLLKLLDISSSESTLLTTYGKLQPPLGKHRLKPTVSAEGRAPPKIGNIGHLNRISNKLVQLGNNNGGIQTYLQENNEWIDWQKNVLSKRNAIENVYQWACGRPTTLQDRTRDSDDDYQDRDYDVTVLANNLSQAFRYDIYSNDDTDEVHDSIERDDEDVYFDDESSEVVISSLRLGDNQESGSLFTNSNWFAFEDDRVSDEHSTGALPSASPNTEGAGVVNGDGEDDKKVVSEDDDSDDTTTSSRVADAKLEVNSADLTDNSREAGPNANVEPPSWVEWRETSDGIGASVSDESATVQNGEPQVKLEDKGSGHDQDGITKPSRSSSSDNTSETPLEPFSKPKNENLVSGDGNPIPPITEVDR